MKIIFYLRPLWILLAIYLLYVLLLFSIQRRIMFPGQVLNPGAAPALSGLPVLKSWLHTSFGDVETWLITPDTARPEIYPALLFAHGNYEIIDYCLDEAFIYKQKGFNVLLVEYPGYGRSEGSPSRKNLRETFLMAYDHLSQEYRIPPSRIVFFGRSIGGGPICDLISLRQPAAVILQSTFTRVTRFTRQFLVPGFLVRDRFDNLSVIRTYLGPLLIFHGKYDNIIPFEHGRQLAQAAPGARFIVQECAHNDCPPDWDDYSTEIVRFISENILE